MFGNDMLPGFPANGCDFDTIIYHGSCPDGWCAAFVAKQRWPQAELIAAHYGQPIAAALSLYGKRILMVDFSFKRDEMVALQEIASLLVVLDHHKTAEAELAGLDGCFFDMNRSGAQLAWDFIHGPVQRPWYVDYVGDRDLWRFKLPNSKAVNAYLLSQPYTMEAWEQLAQLSLPAATQQGLGAQAYLDHYVERVVAHAQDGTHLQPDGLQLRLKIVNAAYPGISDVCNVLAQGGGVGVGWFIRGDGLMQFSLRSIGDLDVSIIAQEFGGGGHKNAAGFQIPADQGLRLLAQWQDVA